MRIVYLLQTADGPGGTERAIITQAGGMARRGHRVTVLSILRTAKSPHFSIPPGVRLRYVVDARDKHAPADQRVPSRLVPPDWDGQFSGATDRLVPAALGRLRGNVVVASTPALGMLAVRFVTGAAVVQQEHRVTAGRGSSRGPLDVFGPQVDCLVSLTAEGTDWLSEHFGSRQPRLETIPNALPNVFRPQASGLEPLVIAAGRLVREKQFQHLIEAFGRASAARPQWRLRIFGDGPERRRLERTVGHLGVSGRVELVPAVPDLLSEWAKGSIAAVTSRTEGLSLSGMEALAAGLPTVSYDCPVGPRHLITDGVTGRLVPPNDIAAFADALAELMDDGGLRSRWGSVAATSLGAFDEEAINARWEALFRELASGSRGSQSTSAAPRPPAQPPTPPVVPTVRPVEQLSMIAIREEVRTAVREALDTAGIVALPVAHLAPARTAFAVSREDRERVLKALEGINVPLAVEALTADETAGEAAAVAAASTVAAGAEVLRVYFPATDAGGLVQRGDEISCDLEFWNPEPGADIFTPPRHNRVLDRIPRAWLADRSQQPAGVAAGDVATLWDEPRFPIDAVFTWVDGSDPAWLRARNRRERSREGRHPGGTADYRFTNRDELKYALRALLDNLPWIRRVYLVTADQRPSWLAATDDRLRLVTHREIFPDSDDLPTFNSHAIECCLHRINGLAEHFLYLNDDVLVARPLPPRLFFDAAGAPRVFLSPVKINYDTVEDPHIGAARTNRALLRERFGVEISHGLMHVPHAMTRSLMQQIEAEFPDAVSRTRANPFRSGDDVSALSSLAQHYGLLTGQARSGTLTYRYIGLGSEDMLRAMGKATAAASRTDIVAIGENPHPVVDSSTIAGSLDTFLRRLAPVRSIYEVDDERIHTAP